MCQHSFIRDETHSCTIYVTCLTHVFKRNMILSWVRDSFVCDMTYSYVPALIHTWRDSHLYHICYMTHPRIYTRHDSFISAIIDSYQTWLVHMYCQWKSFGSKGEEVKREKKKNLATLNMRNVNRLVWSSDCAASIFLFVCVCVCVFVCVRKSLYVHIIYMYVYIYIHVYIYIYMCLYIHIDIKI